MIGLAAIQVLLMFVRYCIQETRNSVDLCCSLGLLHGVVAGNASAIVVGEKVHLVAGSWEVENDSFSLETLPLG